MTRRSLGRRLAIAACAAWATCLAWPLAVAQGAAGAGDEPPRHLIYLHGRIVQAVQEARPHHPRFGYYELEKILAALRGRGFVVSGEIRPRSATVGGAADRVVEQVRQLVGSGVPAARISVVGASMGAAIALVAAARLEEPERRRVILGACASGAVPGLAASQGKGPSGRLLAIREASDELTGDCPAWTGAMDPGASLHVREVVLDTGLGHGFLYRPLPEWVDPVVEWAGSPG